MGKNGRIFYLSWNFLKNLVRFVPPLVSTKLDLDLEQLSQNRLVSTKVIRWVIIF